MTETQTLESAVRSIKFRVKKRDNICQMPGIFKEALHFKEDSQYLELQEPPKLNSTTEIFGVYKRLDTDTYVVRCTNNGVSVIIKAFGVSFRNRQEAGNTLLTDPQIETRYLVLMTALMRAGITDAVTLPIAFFHLKNTAALLDCGFLTKKQKKCAISRPDIPYAVLIAEAADQAVAISLLQISDPCDLSYRTKVAFLQTCHGMAAMHSVFPSFRHNDLHANNVLQQNLDVSLIRASLGSKLPPDYPLLAEYRFCGRRWQVDINRAPFRCLLWDFAFASISARDAARLGLTKVVPKNTKISHSAVPLSRTIPNQYCDIHKFADSLKWSFRKNGIWERCAAELAPLFDSFVPDYLSIELTGLDADIKTQREIAVAHDRLQFTSPTALLLTGHVFDEFRVDNLPPETLFRPVFVVEGVRPGVDPQNLFKWPAIHGPVPFSTSL